jgi:hypothetical protein
LADKNIVLRSINRHGESRCTDIFLRPNGTFGFEEFRRDIEDKRGWFPIGFFGDRVFNSEEDALLEALSAIPWLKDAMNSG